MITGMSLLNYNRNFKAMTIEPNNDSLMPPSKIKTLFRGQEAKFLRRVGQASRITNQNQTAAKQNLDRYESA